MRIWKKKVNEDEKEKVLQEYLFDHLWLLDPAWERATEITPHMEKRVQSEFGKLDACLTKEEKAGRVDIKYRKTTGSHVIIELKRASVKTNTNALIAQMQKYRSGLSKLLQACSGAGNLNHHIECIFVVGENLGDWDYENGRENSQAQFTSQHMRLLQYSELLENANKAYHEYIKATQKVNRLQDILSALDEEDSN